MSDEDTRPNLAKEQGDLIALMEASMSPELLAAIQQAYHASDDEKDVSSVDISYGGTADA